MSRLSVFVGLCLALAAAPLLAGTVYQWKDAKGVTHYSDSPPPKGSYRDREVADGPQAAPVEAKAPVADSAPCAQARLNLVRLQGTADVGLDVDKDGQPDKVMTAEERAKQVDKVHAAIRAHCPGGR